MILRAEREITLELHLLQKLKIFPSAELVIIKKESKGFREKQEGTCSEIDDDQSLESNTVLLENELALTERKLSIIRSRRIDEEEMKLVQKKRVAKAKQIDEIQSKDPLNFKNQTRF
jgi:hypothetical protein